MEERKETGGEEKEEKKRRKGLGQGKVRHSHHLEQDRPGLDSSGQYSAGKGIKLMKRRHTDFRNYCNATKRKETYVDYSGSIDITEID